MSQSGELRAMLATMLRLSPEQISAGTSLAALDTSLGGARLKLGLKRLGLSLPSAHSPSTFGELEAALSGTAPAEAAPEQANAAVAYTSTATAGPQLGIDVQDVHSLPEAKDYWEHEFYTGMFGKSEIAYAVVQSEPRIHLAAHWCAKEALRKCDPSFLKVAFDATVVAHESNGRPYLLWNTTTGPIRLPHALSLSHTRELATAVVMAGSPQQEAKPAKEDSQEPQVDQIPAALTQNAPPPRASRVGSAALFLTIGAALALLVSHFFPV